MKLLTVLTVAALLAPAAASAQELAGKWTATYPAGIRRVNGAEEAQTGTATVTFEVKGDSVFGVWQALNSPRPSAPRVLRGMFTGGKLVLVSAPIEATIQRGGDASGAETVQMIAHYEAVLKEGVLEGTLRHESTDGMVRNGPHKWSARRE